MSSKRRLRRRGCEHKRRYSEDEARRMMGRMDSEGRLRPGSHVYRCNFCGWWHIGRQPQEAGGKRQRVKVWEWNTGV